MADRQLRTVLQYLRQVTDLASAAPLSDGQLLRRFIDRRDEAAFAQLVQRHGPLVLGVCRRLLPRPQDAEDAFQATFLVLVRKARSIARQESVGSWLHGVARRIALRAKGDITRRRRCEQQAPPAPPADTLNEVIWRDLRALLDEELLRLPARCREPFVLCYLEGKTNNEAAHLLGCPAGTVQSRLAKARELLRARLARRGLVVSAGLVAALLPPGSASAAVPAALAAATVSAALRYAAGPALAAGGASIKVMALTEGMVKAMFMTKLKLVTAVLVTVGLISLAAGVPAYHALGAGQVAEKPGLAEPGRGSEPAARGAEPERAEFEIYSLRHARAAEVKRVLDKMFDPRRVAVAADDRTNAIFVRAAPVDLLAVREIIRAADAPPDQKPPEPPAGGPGKTAALPVAPGAPLDLVNLAASYIEAIRAVEQNRARTARIDRLKGAISTEEMETARIDLKAAERKVALLQAIAEAAYQGAVGELEFARAAALAEPGARSQVIAAEAKVKMLKSILDSAK